LWPEACTPTTPAKLGGPNLPSPTTLKRMIPVEMTDKNAMIAILLTDELLVS